MYNAVVVVVNLKIVGLAPYVFLKYIAHNFGYFLPLFFGVSLCVSVARQFSQYVSTIVFVFLLRIQLHTGLHTYLVFKTVEPGADGHGLDVTLAVDAMMVASCKKKDLVYAWFTSTGTDVTILKVFSPQNWRKNCAFF
jgi:hypothetical protein